MKLSISTLACPDWPLEQIVSFAAGSGVGGIEFRGLQKEIDVTRLLAFSVSLEKTLALLRGAGLSMPCLDSSVTLLAPAGPAWEGMIDECHRHARLAGAAGTPFLRIFGGKPPAGLAEGEAIALARRRLRQIVKICRPHHCTPLIATHDDWSTAAGVLELLDGFDCGDAAVLWDMEHSFRRGESPDDTVRALGDFLAHVHIKDSVQFGRRSRPTLLGRGDLPLDDCLRALRESGYDGWITLATEKRWYAEAPEPDQSIPHFTAFLRQRAGSVAS